MSNEEQFLKAVGRASLMAGPLFVLLLALFQYQASSPELLSIPTREIPAIIGSTLVLFPLTMLVGACLAFPVCLLMGGFMLQLANWLPLARPLALWLGVSAGAALAISYGLFDAFDNVGTPAFAGTAMACAALVRSRFHWD